MPSSRWLLAAGRRVRLFTGDQADNAMVDTVRADLVIHGFDPRLLIVQEATSLDELVQQMARVDTVVATRYHNIVCALRLAKPTISLSYAGKCDALMAEMGMAPFCQSVRSLDLERLIAQFVEVERDREQLQNTIAKHTALAALRLLVQTDELSHTLFPALEPSATSRPEPVKPENSW